MQELHLVGFTSDFDGLIFSVRKGAKSGSYRVAVDEQLSKAVAEAFRLADAQRPGVSRAAGDDDEPAGDPGRGELPEHEALNRPAVPPRGTPALSPRQIQERIRAGWSVEEVADEAGTTTEWIWRFARPVLAEVEMVVARAREATVVKARTGRSTLPLAAAVRRNLLDQGTRPAGGVDQGWSAFLLEPGSWVVRFTYESASGRQHAEWLLDLARGDLTARDRRAAALGFTGRGRSPSTGTAKTTSVKPKAAKPKTAKSKAEAVDADGSATTSSPVKKAAARKRTVTKTELAPDVPAVAEVPVVEVPVVEAPVVEAPVVELPVESPRAGDLELVSPPTAPPRRRAR